MWLVVVDRRFQSTLSVRRATVGFADSERIGLFQSTLSVRRATHGHGVKPRGLSISIHALRKESDQVHFSRIIAGCEFQSTLSVRRATTRTHECGRCGIFQSTLSVRRATCTDGGATHGFYISIHALRKESDQTAGAGKLTTEFQSTLSVRRAT